MNKEILENCKIINDILVNWENSTDKEIKDYLRKEFNFNEEITNKIISFRDKALITMDFNIFDELQKEEDEKASYKNKIHSIDLLKEYTDLNINLGSPERVFKQFKEFSNQEKEFFIVAHLNTKNILISHEVVSMGTIDTSIVSPLNIFKWAILKNSASVILIHNHPSGNPKPSEEDISLTRKLEDIGELLKIGILDHVILGKNKYYSFVNGELEECN